MSNYKIILYYNYTDIQNPQLLMQETREICNKLNLKGRIIIATEGINGTLEGVEEDVNKYVDWLTLKPDFKKTHIKWSNGDGNAFPKLKVKVRDEIVSAHLGDKDVNPTKITGKYIYPDELFNWYESGKEFYVVDMRNDYEYKIGMFDNTLVSGMENFRDLPKVTKEISHLKNKTVVTVCTGGVRCEKASGYLVQEGFADVYQLYGGIHTYLEKYSKHFKGKLYVFDGRIAVSFNEAETEIISNCEKCGQKSANYIDCHYLHCKGHRHFICCEDCVAKGEIYCTENCKQAASDEQLVASENLTARSLQLDANR